MPNQFENPMTFVRALKGAPASILWALIFTKAMMTALELQQWTGYRDDAITPALRLLVALGWVVARTPRGPWGLAEGRQLPLMDLELKVDSFTRDISVFSGLDASTTTTTISRVEKIDEVVVVAGKTNPVFPDSYFETYGVTFEANLKACKKNGIGEPKASEISACSWVSPEFIEAHVQSLTPGHVVGLAIVRILSDDLPRKWADDIANLPENASERHAVSAGFHDMMHQRDEYLAKQKKRKTNERKRR